MTADLAAIAATSLRRLAAEMRAVAAIGAQSPAALVSEYEQAQRALAETRREAVADLERLRDSLAEAQARFLTHKQPVTADAIDRWASGWEQHGAGGAP